MSEDGYRFENMIFGLIYQKIYESTAEFIIMESSWNLELEEFRSKVAGYQKNGEATNEDYILQRGGEDYAEWPTLRCEGRVTKFWA